MIKLKDLDIDQRVLDEWLTYNPNLQESLDAYLAEPLSKVSKAAAPKISIVSACGDYRMVNPEALKYYIGFLARNRYTDNALTWAPLEPLMLAYPADESYKASPAALPKILSRIEFALGLLPPAKELPENVKTKKSAAGNVLTLAPAELYRKLSDKRKVFRATAAKLKVSITRANEKRKAKCKLETQAKVSTKLGLTIDEAIYGENSVDIKALLKESDEEHKLKVEEIKPIYVPFPKQAKFHAAPEDVVLFGGGAGPGKTFALIFDAIKEAHNPDMRALIIRVDFPSLREIITKTREFYPKVYPGATYKEKNNTWYFPSGGTVQLGYYDGESDMGQYVGNAYTYIAWDEIQLQRSLEGFDFLMSRLRTTSSIKCYVRATCNPGGNPQIKERFIDPLPREIGEPLGHKAGSFIYKVEGSSDDIKGTSYAFIPATVDDNPALMADPEYVKRLNNMPEIARQRLRYGNWDIVENGFFSFNKDHHTYKEPAQQPGAIISAMDWGVNDPAGVLWAIYNAQDDQIIIFKELQSKPMYVKKWCEEIRGVEKGWVDIPSLRVIDSSLFKHTGHEGLTHIQTMAMQRITPEPANRSRVAGWEEVNRRLIEVTKNGEPKLLIHQSCHNLINQIMSVMPKETNPDDIDDKRTTYRGIKHHYDLLDCLRYLCMSKPQRVTAALPIFSWKTHR